MAQLAGGRLRACVSMVWAALGRVLACEVGATLFVILGAKMANDSGRLWTTGEIRSRMFEDV